MSVKQRALYGWSIQIKRRQGDAMNDLRPYEQLIRMLGNKIVEARNAGDQVADGYTIPDKIGYWGYY